MIAGFIFLGDYMPIIEVSEVTYKMLLKDLAAKRTKVKGSLLKFSGRWSGIPKAKVEEIKGMLRALREESAESVL